MTPGNLRGPGGFQGWGQPQQRLGGGGQQSHHFLTVVTALTMASVLGCLVFLPRFNPLTLICSWSLNPKLSSSQHISFTCNGFGCFYLCVLEDDTVCGRLSSVLPMAKTQRQSYKPMQRCCTGEANRTSRQGSTFSDMVLLQKEKKALQQEYLQFIRRQVSTDLPIAIPSTPPPVQAPDTPPWASSPA